MPAFHGLLPVRDEGDIITQTLTHLLTWCDTLHILDTGSADATWDTVRDLASREPRLVPLESRPVSYTNAVRVELFERARPRFSAGDWVARLDADELYEMPPPDFVSGRVRWPEGRIYSQHYEFVLRRSEADAWERGEVTLADRRRPISQRRRWFYPDPYPELRLFKYRRGMTWRLDGYDPAHAGLLARARIPIRHYRCRDPEQVRVRCAVRSQTRPDKAGEHWRQTDWRKWVIPDEDHRLIEWKDGAPLPELELPGWIPRNRRRAAQWLFYASGAARLTDALGPHRRTDFIDPDPG
jgi:hypothetical protein